jgi:protocatechuate 3,4-dioxygenase beta subunit
MERKQFLKSLGMSSLIAPLIVACSKDDDATPVPSITSFTATSGAVGDTVIISGANFSATTTNNTVTFNGTTATVTAATTTQLTVTVPSGASTGKIAVTVNGQTGTSSSDFTVTTSSSTADLAITSFTSSGSAGSSIVITGTGFSTTAASNTVTINGVVATVVSATVTQLVVTVPSGATSGVVAVTVNGVTVTSATSFTVTTASGSCSATDADIRSDRTGVAFTITITIQDKNNSCAALEGAYVDIWHCDKDGYYSEYGGTSMQTVDYTAVHFLRGRQVTNSDGQVSFVSIFPGWYQSRATHIHVHIYSASSSSLLVTQIGFPESSNSAVVLVNASTANGYTKGMSGYTYNASDSVFTDSIDNEIATVTGSVADGYALTHTIVVSA